MLSVKSLGRTMVVNRERETPLLLLFGLTIFLSATLLFVVQPLFARMALPLLGGSPTVWNIALLFYQTTLLLGYAYAHLTTRWLQPRGQALVHGVVLLAPLLVLPIGIPAGWAPPTDASPIAWLLLVLTVGVGLPFFVLSTTSPLLQRWFAASGHPQAADPYFLYAASNAGSLLALLSYPLLWEPYLRVGDQRTLWSWGYGGLLLLLTLAAGWRWGRPNRVGGAVPVVGAQTAPPLSWRRRIRWVLLALTPSSLMVSVTTFLSTDIAAIPLLWILPLALYLLTFIIVFARRPLIPHRLAGRALPIVVAPLLILLAAHVAQPIRLVIPLHLLAFFVITLVCHGELACNRPSAAQLTEFYLLISFGGALGGAFNALVAPLIFRDVTEYPLMVALACLLMPRLENVAPPQAAIPSLARHLSPRLLDVGLPILLGMLTLLLMVGVKWLSIPQGPIATACMFGIPALVSFRFSRRPLRFGLGVAAILLATAFYRDQQITLLHAERSFFGVLRVTLSEQGDAHMLLHGSTLHGVQWLDPAQRRLPLTYYFPTGPIGQVFAEVIAPAQKRAIAVVGLGTGSLACYRQPGQSWTYYEIDPSVERIARDPKLFTYLHDCDPEAKIVLGDARLSLAHSSDSYDLMILDAYSSDAIPVHLVTREALQLYQERLAPGGLLAFHISNRHLKLEPVLANLSNDAGLVGRAFHDLTLTEDDQKRGKTLSEWVVLARRAEDFGSLAADSRWAPISSLPGTSVWTDDYSSLLSVFRWR